MRPQPPQDRVLGVRGPWSPAERVLRVATLVAVAVTAGLLTAACGGETQPAPSAAVQSVPDNAPSSPLGYTNIGPSELAAKLEHKDFVLINTHVPYAGEIEQTDLFLPFDRAADLVDRLPADKDAEIVVYCRSDRMSSIAAAVWAKAGYTDILNLEGGFEAWEAAGYELLHLEPR